MPPEFQSFTAKSKGLASALVTGIMIHPAFDPMKADSIPPGKKFKAIWDTGATNTVITKRVVQECNLKQIGMTQVHGVGGAMKDCPVYLVNIKLPNDLGVVKVRVTQGMITDGIDALIGMDIILLGDFAVTSYQGKTTFSFRTPSKERIDFVKDHKKGQVVKSEKISRNVPCPCGSGKKYKKCCGKN